VFRSLKSKSYAESDRINKFPLTGTQCVDATVAPKTTYYYVVKAVAQSGVQSVVSEEIKAVIPLP
jgi:chitodextrinase